MNRTNALTVMAAARHNSRRDKVIRAELRRDQDTEAKQMLVERRRQRACSRLLRDMTPDYVNRCNRGPAGFGSRYRAA